MSTINEKKGFPIRNAVAWFCMMLFFVTSVYAQNKNISGTVKDESGEAIIGANVKLVG